jgi:hypothetical protein
MRSSLFWDVTQSRLVVSYQRFGTTYRSYLQGSSSQRPLKDGTNTLSRHVVTTNLRCVTSQKSEDVICNRGGSLKSRTSINQLSNDAGFRLYVENVADIYEIQLKKWQNIT